MGRRGRGWDFPNVNNEEQIQALIAIRVDILLTENRELRARIVELESELVERDREIEILDAEIVESQDD